MAMVTEKEWKEKADNLAKWRAERRSKPNFELYDKIVGLTYAGGTVLDVGAGQCHLKRCLPEGVEYTAIDPVPLSPEVLNVSAENLNFWEATYNTVYMLSALDNTMDVESALKGLKNVSKGNIVILTGIEIEPDKYHTHKIKRNDLINVLGFPKIELAMFPSVYLFSFEV